MSKINYHLNEMTLCLVSSNNPLHYFSYLSALVRTASVILIPEILHICFSENSKLGKVAYQKMLPESAKSQKYSKKMALSFFKKVTFMILFRYWTYCLIRFFIQILLLSQTCMLLKNAKYDYKYDHSRKTSIKIS